jgi:hypothetical protein
VSERITEKRNPSVLGIYKENPGPEELIATVCDDSSSLYVELPTYLRNLLEVVVGSQFVGKLLWIMKENGEMIYIAAAGVFEVKGYWNEMHLPDLMVQRFEIKKGDSLKFVLHQIINYGEKTNF